MCAARAAYAGFVPFVTWGPVARHSASPSILGE